jgi:hypothetical protein
MNTRSLVIGLGVLVSLVSVFADVLGLGSEPRFGWKQIVGLVVGLVLIGVGFTWRRFSR